MSMDYEVVKPTSNRSYVVALLLAFFFGGFGVHRFYTGYVGIGIAQLLLCWTGIGPLWALIDLISLALNKYKDVDGAELADHNPGCGMIVLIVVIASFIIGGICSVLSLMLGTAALLG